MKLKEKLLSLLVRWLGFGLRARLPQVVPSPAISHDMSPDGNAVLPKVSLLALDKMAAEPGQSFNALPQLPLGVIPPQLLAQDGHTHASLAMAQDNAAFCHAFLNGAVQGTGFKGYAALAELSQLSEYRSPTETLATEMTRQWISFKSTGAENRSEQLQAIEAAFDQFKIRDKLKQAVEHDGFFGRGMLYIDMGMPELNDTPLIINKATIRQGSVQGFKVIEPVWTSPANYNATDPTAKDFYQPHSWYVMGRQIHTSRLITLIARPLPDMLKPAYNFSGLSMTQLLEPAVNAWLRTRDSVSELVHSFSTSGVKTDMQAVLSGGNGDDILHRAQLFNQMRDNRGLMLLDKDNEEFFQFHTPLGGMESLQAQAQEQMAAPCHIPLVKLFGITPHGLNASSEGEIKVFYDYIQAMQQTLLTDPLVKILQIIQLHLFGEIYDDITFEYCPLEQMNEQQEVSISKAKVEIGSALLQAGVISKEEERQRLAADPLSGYDGLGDGLSEALPEQEQAGQSEQSLFNPAQDGQVKNPEFELLHDRDEDGRFTCKGQGVPLKYVPPSAPEHKNQNNNSMLNTLGYKNGYSLPAYISAKSAAKASGTNKAKAPAISNASNTAVNKPATALAEKQVLSLKKTDYEKHADYITGEEISQIQKAIDNKSSVVFNDGLKKKLIALLGKNNVQSEWAKYPGYPHTMFLSQETLRKAREAFLAIGNGNLPDLIGFSNNHKEDKSLAYQSLLDAVGEHVSDATKLVMYRQLSDNKNPYAGFVDLSQGIDESIAHYLPEAKKYADRLNEDLKNSAQFSPFGAYVSPFETEEERVQGYVESYLSSMKLKSDAPAFMRKDARIDLGLTVASIIPVEGGIAIAIRLTRGARYAPKTIIKRLPKGSEPDNDLYSLGYPIPTRVKPGNKTHLFNSYKTIKDVPEFYRLEPRFKSLASDPARKGRIDMEGYREAMAGLEAENLGLVEGLRRGPPRIEFYDYKGVPYDVKTPPSSLIPHQENSMRDAANSIIKKLKLIQPNGVTGKPELVKVILDSTYLNAADHAKLWKIIHSDVAKGKLTKEQLDNIIEINTRTK